MMKIRTLAVLLLSTLIVFLAFGCASTGSSDPGVGFIAEDEEDEEPAVVWDNPDKITDVAPGAGSVGGEDTAKINFEGDFGSFVYAPGTALTDKDTNTTAVPSTDFFYAGKQSMRLDGTMQKYKYANMNLIGYRINAAEMLGKKNLELVGKMIKVHVYVPAEFHNTAIQLLILDIGFSWAESSAVELEPGKWNTVYFKLLSSGSKENTKYSGSQCSLATYDEEGNKRFRGNYTGNGFNSYTINALEIRSINGTPDDNATVFIDSIDWE